MDAIKKAIGTYRYGLWVNAGSPKGRKEILSVKGLGPKSADRIIELLQPPKPSLDGLDLDLSPNGWLQIDGADVKCEYVWHNGHGLVVEKETGNLVTSFTVPGREIFSSHDLGTDLRHHGGVTLRLGTCRELGLTEATWSYI